MLEFSHEKNSIFRTKFIIKGIFKIKTEYLSTDLENEERLETENAEIKKDNKFKYLESILELDEKSNCEIEKRISEERKVTGIQNSIL